MARVLLGIALSTVVVYLWGFVYWGASSLPYSTWNETADDAAAGRVLVEHFSQSGVYYIPSPNNDPELRAELYASGPTGFVIVDVDGRPEFDTAIMAQGFFLNGVVMAVLAILLRLCLGSAPRYLDRVKVVALVGLIAVLMVNVGDIVWWAMPAGWEFAQIFYNFTAMLLGGSIVAHFVRPAN